MANAPTPEILPDTGQQEKTSEKTIREPGYLVVCWNDPVNIMEFVTHVFQQVFGWDKARAERHVIEVCNQGKSILTRENMERAEHYVHELQKYTLHATMERD